MFPSISFLAASSFAEARRKHEGIRQPRPGKQAGTLPPCSFDGRNLGRVQFYEGTALEHQDLVGCRSDWAPMKEDSSGLPLCLPVAPLGHYSTVARARLQRIVSQAAAPRLDRMQLPDKMSTTEMGTRSTTVEGTWRQREEAATGLKRNFRCFVNLKWQAL